MTAIGDRIRLRREALHMTQDELAACLGYAGRSSITKIEKGTADFPSRMLAQFADALQTSPAYLMGWTDDDRSYSAILKANGWTMPADFEPDKSQEDRSQAYIKYREAVSDFGGDTLTEDERRLVEAYRVMPEDKRKALFALLGL